MAYLAAIRDVLPRDGFFVEEICQTGFTSIRPAGIRASHVRDLRLPRHARLRLLDSLGVQAGNPGKTGAVEFRATAGFMFGVQNSPRRFSTTFRW